MEIVGLLRNVRLYAIQKGAVNGFAKLEILEAGQAHISVFLLPFDKVLMMTVDDNDWQDISAMQEYICNEIVKAIG